METDVLPHPPSSLSSLLSLSTRTHSPLDPASSACSFVDSYSSLNHGGYYCIITLIICTILMSRFMNIFSKTIYNKFVYTKAQSRVIGQEQLGPKIMKKMKLWTFLTFLKI